MEPRARVRRDPPLRQGVTEELASQLGGFLELRDQPQIHESEVGRVIQLLGGQMVQEVLEFNVRNHEDTA